MEKIKKYFEGLNKKQRIIVYAAIAIIVLMVLRVAVWKATQKNIPTTRKYIRQIESKNKNQQLAAIFNLGRTNSKEALPGLEEVLLNDPDEHTKVVAAWSIGSIDKTKLVELLKTDNRQVKLIVMDTLIKMGRENLEYIFGMLHDTDTAVRTAALGYIENFGGTGYNEKLLALAEKTDENLQLRLACLSVLQKTGTPDLEPRFSNLYYNDKNDEIKKAAKETIDGLTKKGGENK